MSDIQSIVKSFTSQLTAVIEAQALAKARSAVLAALGGNIPVAKRRGRPPKNLQVAPVPQLAIAKAQAKTPRKKTSRQLCPVPGCKNPAAPIFGMVCSEHKSVAKSKIKKYRELRKAKKLGIQVVGKKAPKRQARKATARKATPRKATAKKAVAKKAAAKKAVAKKAAARKATARKAVAKKAAAKKTVANKAVAKKAVAKEQAAPARASAATAVA